MKLTLFGFRKLLLKITFGSKKTESKVTGWTKVHEELQNF